MATPGVCEVSQAPVGVGSLAPTSRRENSSVADRTGVASPSFQDIPTPEKGPQPHGLLPASVHTTAPHMFSLCSADKVNRS